MKFATSLPNTVLYSVYFLLLFKKTILRLFHNDNKIELFTPEFICVLHTFGRDLKWNPHNHCLVSDGGVGNSGNMDYFLNEDEDDIFFSDDSEGFFIF